MTHNTFRSRPLMIAALTVGAVLGLSACGVQPSAQPTGDGPDCGFPAALISAAKQEGAVTMYGGPTREASERLSAEFEEAYGITATVVRQPSEEAVRMLSAELAAGRVNADVISLSDSAAMAELNAMGALTDAEILNRDEIREGLDAPDAPQVPNAATPLGIAYNEESDVVVPKTWDEVANFSGRIAIADPGKSGTALVFFATLEEELGQDFLETLSERDVIVTDSALALAQLVLTGEVDIALPALEPAVIAAASGGEPLAIAFPSGGTPILVTELGVLADAPNPNAAKLLVGFQLCRDFQESVADIGGRSVLVDPPVSKGVEDLSDATELTTTPAKLQGVAQDLRARFTELFS